MVEEYYLKSWVEVAEKLNMGYSTVILPVGTTEAHGAHLPLSTDTLVPLEIARRLSQLPMNKFMGLRVGFEARFAYGLSRNLIGTPGAVRHAVPLRLARSSSQSCPPTGAFITLGNRALRLAQASAEDIKKDEV